MPDSVSEDSLRADVQVAEKLKSSLWYYVGQLVDEETINLGVNATPQFIGSLTELVWAQIGNAGTDLESFAKHAGRTTIKVDDVLLLARRNEGLESILQQKVADLKKAAEARSKERRDSDQA